MRLAFITVQITILICCVAFYPNGTERKDKDISPIEAYAQKFSRQYKTWTEDNITIANINKLFADSLNNFYAVHKEAFNNLVLRLENVSDSGNGRRIASFECWDHYVDNKQLRAHVYANIPDTIKRLFTGNDYVVLGKIEKFNVYNGVGYNKVDNTCDVGIVTITTEKLIHLKGHNKSSEEPF